MQNFRYAPAWDEACHMFQIQSPSTYCLIRKHFPVRSARSFRYKVSRQPQFPMEISPTCFELAKSYLDMLKYDGMAGLSCDDTKLFSALCLFWDGEKDKHFLVGYSEGPLEVVDPSQMQEVLENAKKHKATKVGAGIGTFGWPTHNFIATTVLLDARGSQGCTDNCCHFTDCIQPQCTNTLQLHT
jgi:hypothetical protein